MDERHILGLTVGMSIGVALRAGIGVALDNVAIGAGLGAAFVARNDEDSRG